MPVLTSENPLFTTLTIPTFLFFSLQLFSFCQPVYTSHPVNHRTPLILSTTELLSFCQPQNSFHLFNHSTPLKMETSFSVHATGNFGRTLWDLFIDMYPQSLCAPHSTCNKNKIRKYMFLQLQTMHTHTRTYTRALARTQTTHFSKTPNLELVIKSSGSTSFRFSYAK